MPHRKARRRGRQAWRSVVLAGPRHGAGARYEGRWRSLAAACLAAAASVPGASPARAGSAAQPGQSVGLPVGAQIPHGLYLITASNFGVRDTAAGVLPLNVNTATLAWSTPWDLLGARVQLFAGVPYSAVGPQNREWQSGFGQPLLAGQLAWDLGGDVGFSYLLGGYLPSRTGFTTQVPSLTHRFALSYVGNDWNVTGHLFYGHFLGDRPPPGVATYPDYMNLDFTATKKFGKWQVGAVAFASTDLPTGVAGYRSQGQVAVGGLVGYNFGPVNLQAFVTRDVIERNYGGLDTRAWLRAVIPLYQDKQEAAPGRTLVTREQSR
ncbi:transporter [Methylobacterium terricola]|uniref:Transporter n=1 Tax=Methylobacterium terricola TaxID=2583531 RepID=A0A5C4LL64_9HYPH|nr:transporter [Methylobacterium terricola]